jgi:hypothetical protein
MEEFPWNIVHPAFIFHNPWCPWRPGCENGLNTGRKIPSWKVRGGERPSMEISTSPPRFVEGGNPLYRLTDKKIA